MTILVADDNAFSRELMRELLEAAGHLVLEAVNGEQRTGHDLPVRT